MSHSSMLKARRKNQRTQRLLKVAAKRARRLEKEALSGPVVKKEKVKKERVKSETVKPTKVKKSKDAKVELSRQAAKPKEGGKKGG